MKKLYFVLLLAFIQTAGFGQIHQHRISLNPALRPFYHGVESGDPMPDHVIIWTRVTPDSGIAEDIDVYWEVATDVNFTNIVNYGTSVATEANHYCVKEDICGLQPSTYYYYMFHAFGRNSIVGRTKTAPAANDDNDSVRFAVTSCASWEHGFFNAYESISNRNDVDAVLNLGDYIYEYASGGFSANIQGRTYDPPTEAITELGYELRYSQYKLDDQLRRLHQLFPFIAVWDDHETANNAWRDGAENHTPGTEGPYDVRKRNSTSTYFKWMPIRKPDPADTLRIFRRLRYGKLLDLVMLDTRLYDRDEQNLGSTNDPNHHMMGPVERAWFLQQLSDTSTRWKVIGNQVMFAPLEVFGTPVNSDSWDGYNYERTLIQNHILNNNINDVVVLTGDIHTSWCTDVPGTNYNASTGAGSICVEFVGSSITSANVPLGVGSTLIRTLNPHMKYINLDDHGYYTLDVTKSRAQADYTFVSRIDQLGASNVAGPHYYMNHNERHLRSAANYAGSTPIAAANPPLLPDQNLPFYKTTDHFVSTPENTPVTVNVVPGLQFCPFRTMTVSQGQHGQAQSTNGQDVTYTPSHNYNGNDTIHLIFCTTDTVQVCDTFYLFVEVLPVQDIDSFTIHLGRDTTFAACLSFNDLVSSALAVQGTALHGQLIITDTCFIYTPDSSFCGTETILFTTCDGSSNCDTIVYIFKVEFPITASVEEVTLNKNTNTTYCLLFDDLATRPVSVTWPLLPRHGTFQMQGDSCVKYFPYFNYVGDDTMQFIGCDTCGINHCDTITVIFHVIQPTAVEEPGSLVVFGMFPNPAHDKVVVQFYLYQAAEVTTTIYDAAGRKLQSTTTLESEGLQHLQLNTAGLSKGNYFIELATPANGFRKMIVKD